MSLKRDYIGYDPIAWVDRLMDVIRDSQFDHESRELITGDLVTLRERLLRHQEKDKG